MGLSGFRVLRCAVGTFIAGESRSPCILRRLERQFHRSRNTPTWPVREAADSRKPGGAAATGRPWRCNPGKFRDRLVRMTANAGLSVIVADPACTSRWGAQHWLAPLRDHHPQATGHHAAALVTGRRGLGHRARRRANGNQPAPEEAARPAQARPRTAPAPRPAQRKPATPRGPRQPTGTKTGRPHRTTAGNQAAQDRPGPPATQDHLLHARLGTVTLDSRSSRMRSRPAW